jgi:hypothetical protein
MIKAMKQALEAIKNNAGNPERVYQLANAALKEALATPVQEPLMEPEGKCKECLTYNGHQDGCSHATPPAAAQPAMSWEEMQSNYLDLLSDVTQAKEVMRSAGCAGTFLEMFEEFATRPAAQRTWVGLTDTELVDMHATLMVKLRGCYETKDLYKAIEAKLKEKNT